ncbi:MAG: hypothetical protein H0X29_03355 [Parachlamydiaceae bacterium]|nr:hypothetical protein [Parachlamydiaceae bacterium]
MALNSEFKEILEKEIAGVSQSKLTYAAKELSQRYRSPDRDASNAFMTTEAHHLAYLAVRLPGTYAAIKRVLHEVNNRMAQASIKSVLDVGAGPGTASWVAAGCFSKLQKVTLLEQDAGWFTIGKRMMRAASTKVLQTAEWHQRGQLKASEFPKHDLVIMSYVVGEIPLDLLPALISEGWAATGQIMVVIEPGTPHGFERIRQIRQQLIDSGAQIIAPCPHAGKCPMEKNDWCHFAERLERSVFHMAIKDVCLSYEDEKYSYIAVAKTPVVLPESRILRHPQKHKGHIGFTLCAQNGLEQKIISKKLGDLYKQSRKLEWGDVFPPETIEEDFDESC